MAICRENEDEGEELTPWGEQAAWEAHQVAQASMKTGSKDKQSQQPQYELVLPDAVEFIAAQAIQGNLVSSISLRPDCSTFKFLQILLSRRYMSQRLQCIMPHTCACTSRLFASCARLDPDRGWKDRNCNPLHDLLVQTRP